MSKIINTVVQLFFFSFNIRILVDLYSYLFSAHDCFELGRQSYNNHDYYHTVLWMREALRKYETEKNDTTVYEWEILEYLAYSLYMQGTVGAIKQ